MYIQQSRIKGMLFNIHWRIQRGACGGCNPPLIFQKIVVIRVAVVVDLVVTSSNNACLCAVLQFE